MRDDDRGCGELHHLSGYVRCPCRSAVALINAAVRQRPTGEMRSIVWCSLRGEAQWCAEECGAPNSHVDLRENAITR